MRDRLADIVRDLVHGRAGLLLFGRKIQKQSLAQRRAERVDGDELPLGVFFPQLVTGDRAGLVRCAQTGGEADKEDVKAFLQLFFHDGGKL